jgi:hypothetical protein
MALTTPEGNRPPGYSAGQEKTTERMMPEERDAMIPSSNVRKYYSRNTIIEADRVPLGVEKSFFETGCTHLTEPDNLITRRLRIEEPPEE